MNTLDPARRAAIVRALVEGNSIRATCRLTWAVQGCLAWQCQGLDAPLIVRTATASYRAEEDTLGLFLEEACESASHERVAARELFHRYREWAEERGERRMAEKEFSAAMLARRFQKVKTSRSNCWVGLRLLPAVDSDVPGVEGGGSWRENPIPPSRARIGEVMEKHSISLHPPQGRDAA